MVARLLKCALAIGASLAFLIPISPSAAAPMSVRKLAEQNLRLATIGYRISTASAGNCEDPTMYTGLLLHELSAYDRGARPAVSRAFGLGAGIGVIEIVPDSAADRAGLHVGDEILSVNDASVEDPSAIDQEGKSYRRLEGFSKLLQAKLKAAPADLTVRRNDEVVRVRLEGELGCGGEPSLSNSRGLNAWSDGSHVMVTGAMMKLARSNDQLAFVIAHEMAHNILGHARFSSPSIFGISFGGRRQELAADSMAVSLMAAAGYKPEGGISFLRTVGRRYWWNVSLDHPGFGTRIKAVAGAIAYLSALQASRGRVAVRTAPAGESAGGRAEWMKDPVAG